MKTSIREKLEKAEQRLEELRHLLSEPEVLEDLQQFRDLSVEYARLQPTVEAFEGYQRLEQELSAAQDMLHDADSDLRALGAEEITQVKQALEQRDAELQRLLLPRDERDERN